MAIWVNGPAAAVARSTLKPVSFDELSVQVSVIWLEEAAVAASPVGAAGMDSEVVALAVPE